MNNWRGILNFAAFVFLSCVSGTAKAQGCNEPLCSHPERLVIRCNVAETLRSTRIGLETYIAEEFERINQGTRASVKIKFSLVGENPDVAPFLASSADVAASGGGSMFITSSGLMEITAPPLWNHPCQANVKGAVKITLVRPDGTTQLSTAEIAQFQAVGQFQVTRAIRK